MPAIAESPTTASRMTTVSRPDAPNTLLFFLSQRENYRQPLFSRNETFCSPDSMTEAVFGEISALQTPLGSYDVADFIRATPGLAKPELLIVKADASLRNCPRNLFKLKCPKVLIVGDTHHMGRPLQNVIRYALEEPFTHIVFDHTRHHAHFFMEAGLKNVHWIPAVDFAFNSREPSLTPSRKLSFVGQVGQHHPFRRHILGSLQSAGLPLQVLRGTTQEAADIYADSEITLNVSLNGDLNLRVFESLAAGGFLMTDKLSDASGLPLLFEDGKHLVTWSSLGELQEKIRYYLEHPAEARAIRNAGHAELVANHSPEVKIRELLDLVYDGRCNPRYDLASERERCSVGYSRQNQERFRRARLLPYELIQETHRSSLATVVWCAKPEQHADLLDLPRLSFRPASEIPTEALKDTSELLLIDSPEADLPSLLLKRCFTKLVVSSESASLSTSLSEWGYSADAANAAHFELISHACLMRKAAELGNEDFIAQNIQKSILSARSPEECLSLSELVEQYGADQLQMSAIERAVALDRNHAGALIALAAASMGTEDPAITLILLEELARLGPLPSEAVELHAKLKAELPDSLSLKTYYELSGLLPVKPAEQPRKILVVTNLFPPQELGGYGRKMWEFTNQLRKRGHQVRVLAGDLPKLAKAPNAEETALEPVVSRSLRLLGSWEKGSPTPIEDVGLVMENDQHNRQLLQDTIAEMQPDIVFAGNMDFLGVGIPETALGLGLPVLQALGNPVPGYYPHEQPTSPRYWIGSCSHWNAAKLQSQGFAPARVDVIYPGARVDRFFRVTLPDRQTLRICFAGLVMPFKGVRTLIDALGLLQQNGIGFSIEIAGESTNPDFIKELKEAAASYGFADKLHFTGFLDREGLCALFSRSNILVFPSIVEEGFGISQVEALASGLVVVSSGTGGAREIIRDRVDGLLFPAGNQRALAEALFQLHANPELFASLQAGAQRRAIEFSVPKSVEKIEELITGLLAT